MASNTLQLGIIPAYAALLLVLVSGCGLGDEKGFKSSDEQFMAELEAALTQSQIPFRMGPDGFTRYAAAQDESVQRVREQLERENVSSVATKYPDKEARQRLMEILASRRMKYRVENHDGGVWIHWHPKTEAERREIEMSVVQSHFENVERRSPSPCAGEAPAARASLPNANSSKLGSC